MQSLTHAALESLNMSSDAASGSDAAALLASETQSVASHSTNPSITSIASVGSATSLNLEQDIDDGNDATKICVPVLINWNQSYQEQLLVFASHNNFSEGVELTGDAENGYSVTISAPVGELLYRFSVDGEWQTVPDAPVMNLGGDEFNVMNVAEAPVASATSANEDDMTSPVRLKRRQSSIHWDTRRSALVIAEESSPGQDGNTAASSSSSASNTLLSPPIAATAAGLSQPSTPNPKASPSPRFVNIGANVSVLPGTGPSTASVEEGENENDEDLASGDEDDTAPASGEAGGEGLMAGSARTKRKNKAHRLKLKQRALFQSPPQLSNSAPNFQTPNASPPQPPKGVPNTPGYGTMNKMTLSALQMEALQRENEWKEAWLAHEIQTFQAREEERRVMKIQMNEERGRWIAKLKEYTAETKTLREENLALKSDLAANSSSARYEKNNKARTERFATLQKDILAEERTLWEKEKEKLQAELEKQRTELAALSTSQQSSQSQLQSASNELQQVQLKLQAQAKENSLLVEEKTQLQSRLEAQLKQSATQGAEALEQLQSALSAEHQKSATLRGEVASLTAGLEGEKLAHEQTKKSETISKEQLEKVRKEAKEAEEAQSASLAAIQAKYVQTQSLYLNKSSELDSLVQEKELKEMEFESSLQTYKQKESELLREMESLRHSASESSTTIRELNKRTQELRSALQELQQTTVNQSVNFQRSLSEMQSFLLDALQVQSKLLHNTMNKYRKEMSERRKLHNLVQELRGNIRVYARARPLSENEKTHGLTEAIHVLPSDEAGEPATELQVETSRGKVTYAFDSVFGPASSQHEVFKQISSLVTSVLDGYNVCLFAYGQTGSGKTHTMTGLPTDPGMNLRSLTELFRLRTERREDFNYRISCSFYEIYNEQVKDLLDTSEKELKIRQSSTGVYVEGLTERSVESQEDVIRIMEEGTRNRSVGKTEMNAHSSRSHSILSVTVNGSSHVTGMTYLGKLHLIDLAGSERISRSQATGDRLKEAQAINLSLSALGNVIEALQKKQSHIPYRNSKLTHILSSSLGGHAKTLMFVNVSPASADVDETSCSLQFAARARATELGSAARNASVAPASSPSSEDSGVPTPSSSPPPSALSSPVAAKSRPVSALASASKRGSVNAGSSSSSAVKKPVAPSSATKKPITKS